MLVEDIIGLCIGIPALISLIVLMYIVFIKSVDTDREYKKIQIEYYKKRIDEINFGLQCHKEEEDFE